MNRENAEVSRKEILGNKHYLTPYAIKNRFKKIRIGNAGLSPYQLKD